MFKIAEPSPADLARFLAQQAGAPFSYGERGATRREAPRGYDRASARVVVGRGPGAFASARAALERFAMFPAWTRVCAVAGGAQGPIELREGLDLVVAIRALGLWWLNGARVVYVEDEPRRWAFAYGTLASHVERGEERFAVEWEADDTVSYVLSSFSRPRLFAARLGYPLTRALQRRFVHDSLAAMQRAVEASA
jgi:uncharacterized protein (UPF0548 family)